MGKNDNDRRAGVEAGSQVRRETIDACKRQKITAAFILKHFKRLARFKGKKAFCFQGEVFYSDPLDDTTVQLGALRELARLLDMYPKEDDGKGRSSDRLDELMDAFRSGPIPRGQSYGDDGDD